MTKPGNTKDETCSYFNDDSFVLPDPTSLKSFILFLSFTFVLFSHADNELRTIQKGTAFFRFGTPFQKGQRNSPSFKIASKAVNAVLSTEPMTDGCYIII